MDYEAISSMTKRTDFVLSKPSNLKSARQIEHLSSGSACLQAQSFDVRESTISPLHFVNYFLQLKIILYCPTQFAFVFFRDALSTSYNSGCKRHPPQPRIRDSYLAFCKSRIHQSRKNSFWQLPDRGHHWKISSLNQRRATMYRWWQAKYFWQLWRWLISKMRLFIQTGSTWASAHGPYYLVTIPIYSITLVWNYQLMFFDTFFETKFNSLNSILLE